MSSSKRHFKIIIDSKENGNYVSSTPSSAARKAVSKLCADNKNRKVKFSIRETTQGSKKKTYGPYTGYMQKLDKPVELEGRVIKYKSIAKLEKKSIKISEKKSSNSKNLVIGGGIKNLNSQKSSAIGNYVGGNHSSQHQVIPPYIRAIFSACRSTAIGQRVDPQQITIFAKEQGRLNPHLLKKFNQSDIDSARKLFERTSQPISVAPHNPNNLFGQIYREGKKLGIDKDLLIDYLKWYVTQPGISEIAENPKPADIQLGYDAMVLEISPGANMFREVCSKGLSPATIGHQGFSKLMENSPPGNYMWAFNKCPPLKEVQEKLCFQKIGRLENISCFIAGIIFHPNGTIGIFKQSMRNNKIDPDYQIGKPVVLWPCRVGHYVYTARTSHLDNLPTGNDRLYGEHGKYVGHNSHFRFLATKEEENRASMSIVPRVADNIRHGEMEKILSNPDYYHACHEVMNIIGGIPVSLDITPENQENKEAVSSKFINNNSKNSIEKNPWGAAGL